MNPVSAHDSDLKVAYTDPLACLHLADRLGHYLHALPPGKPIAVVCLGTDRSTGDSLGPLTGHALSKFHSPYFELFGTLENPVHALNLDDTLDQLRCRIPNAFIIAIDACLGKPSSIGLIKVGEGPLYPGAGVNKDLPPVGDIHISAVVNFGGTMEYLVLQCTRLHIVMSMAQLIAHSLIMAVNRTVWS